MRWIVAGLFVMMAVAGCLNDGTNMEDRPTIADGDGDGHVVIRSSGRSIASPDTQIFVDPLDTPTILQLCDYGYRVVEFAPNYITNEPAPTDRACDFRVTKPLQDPTLFDWRNQHGPANEVSLAVNPTDPLNLIGGAKDYTVSYISEQGGCGEFNVWMGQFWSHDAGRTWGNDLIQGFPGDDRDSPLRGNLCNTDPVMVFDSDGTAWFNALNYRGQREGAVDVAPPGSDGATTGSQIFFARSQDAGETYDRITFASAGDNANAIFNDKNWLAVDPNSDHMIHTWSNFIGPTDAMMYVESFDAGATWTPPMPLSPGATIPGVTGPGVGAHVPAAGQFSMPQYDSLGIVWVIWNGVGGIVVTEGIRATNDGPVAFQPTHRVVQPGSHGMSDCLSAANFRRSVYPVLAVDTSGGPFDQRKYVAYPNDGVSGAGVFVTYSDDGIEWSTPYEVTLELEDDQFMPWIDVGPDGMVHVAYYDCSTGEDGMMGVGYTWSMDGGQTWQVPMVVSQALFDGNLGHHQSGAPFIGDYIAVDASETGVHFFWADTRHTGVEGEGRPAGSDVYAATLIMQLEHMALYAPEIAE